VEAATNQLGDTESNVKKIFFYATVKIASLIGCCLTLDAYM